MKHKILAAVVALVGFGALTAASLPAASARSGNGKHPVECKDGAKKVGDKCVCPDGRTYVGDSCTCPNGVDHGNGRDYCECPKGTQNVNDYCEGVSPQGPPTVDDWVLWGAKGDHEGPALKFYLLKGTNGARGLVQFTLILPDGLTFGDNSKLALITGLKSLKLTKTTLTATLDPDQSKVLTYLMNHLLIESKYLRWQLTTGKIKYVTFLVDVTDAKGKTTDLAFNATPVS